MAMCKFGKEKTVTEPFKMVSRSIEGVLTAVWVSLGGCTRHFAAIRVCLAQWHYK
jgi:hypothetical protein